MNTSDWISVANIIIGIITFAVGLLVGWVIALRGRGTKRTGMLLTISAEIEDNVARLNEIKSAPKEYDDPSGILDTKMWVANSAALGGMMRRRDHTKVQEHYEKLERLIEFKDDPRPRPIADLTNDALLSAQNAQKAINKYLTWFRRKWGVVWY